MKRSEAKVNDTLSAAHQTNHKTTVRHSETEGLPKKCQMKKLNLTSLLPRIISASCSGIVKCYNGSDFSHFPCVTTYMREFNILFNKIKGEISSFNQSKGFITVHCKIIKINRDSVKEKLTRFIDCLLIHRRRIFNHFPGQAEAK